MPPGTVQLTTPLTKPTKITAENVKPNSANFPLSPMAGYGTPNSPWLGRRVNFALALPTQLLLSVALSLSAKVLYPVKFYPLKGSGLGH